MNNLFIEGRTTRDFIERNGIALSSIAVEKYKGSFFIDVACFGKVAEYCVANVKKGTRVVVEGELNVFEKDGKKYVSCSAKNIINCGRKETTEKPQELLERKIGGDDIVAVDEVDISADDLPF